MTETELLTLPQVKIELLCCKTINKRFNCYVCCPERIKKIVYKIKNTLWLSITQNANIPGYRVDNGELIYDGDEFRGFMIYKNKVR